MSPSEPLVPPHRAQIQRARSCAVGLATGPHACTTRAHGKQTAAQRTGGWGRESARPPTPLTETRGIPLGAPVPPRLARTLANGPKARTPCAQGKRAAAPGTGDWGKESAQLPTPLTVAPGTPPPGAFVQPPQNARPARKSVRCGVGDGCPRPQPPRPRKRGSGPRPPAPRTGSSGKKGA